MPLDCMVSLVYVTAEYALRFYMAEFTGHFQQNFRDLHHIFPLIMNDINI